MGSLNPRAKATSRKMKAARFFSPSRDGPTPIDVTILPKPTCPKSGALVRVRYSGICHSDLHLWEGSYDLGGGKRSHFQDRPHFKYPLTPGHEIAGRIEEIGVAAAAAAAAPSFDLTIGDRVIVYPWIGCTVCARCRHKLTNLCEGDANAGKDVGFYEAGGYAEYVVVPDVAYVVKIPDDFDGPTAATLPCAGLTAYAAVTKATASALQRAADVDETPRLLIVGAGGVGRWAATLARFCVPSRTRIVVADVNQAKLDDVGACRIVDELILWRNDDDVDDDLRRTVDVAGGRLDAVVDFVNSSVTAKLSLECTRCGGTVVAVGLFGGSAEIALPSIALSSRSIVGSYTGNVGQLRDLVRLVSDQRTISTPPVVKCRLDEIQSILERLRVGKIVGRAVIDMEAVVDS